MDDKSKRAETTEALCGGHRSAALCRRSGRPSPQATRPHQKIGRANPGADRFARLDAGTGAPGRRQRFGRSAEQGDRRRCAAVTRATLRPSWSNFCATRSSIPIRSSTITVLQPIGWDAIGSPGFLFVQGPRYDIFRTYTVDESRLIVAVWRCFDHDTDERLFRRSDAQRQRQVLDLTAIIRQMSERIRK